MSECQHQFERVDPQPLYAADHYRCDKCGQVKAVTRKKEKEDE